MNALERASAVHLAGCGLLPREEAVWSGQSSWHVLDTHFGDGAGFVACWLAWKASGHRPNRLFYTAIDARPVSAETLLQVIDGPPEAALMARELAQQWWGLLPGVHRLVFEQGRVMLTLHAGDPAEVLPGLDATVDSVFLKPSHPEDGDGALAIPLLKAIGRLCREGARLTWEARLANPPEGPESAGFLFEDLPDQPAGHVNRCARYAPRWTRRPFTRLPDRTPDDNEARRAVVVGGGLAGSAVAHSLALRGWQVDVLDREMVPAQGASALPVGLVAPHVSPDDAPLSRLSRSGVRLTLQRLSALMKAGIDWAPSGVLEHRADDKRSLPRTEAWQSWGHDWSSPARAEHRSAAQLHGDANAVWHACGAWVKPARLVEAQLQHAQIHWRGGVNIERLERLGDSWQLLDGNGEVLATAHTAVLASAWSTHHLLLRLGYQSLPLHPLRGQITWGPVDTLSAEVLSQLPPFPMNGQGALVHHVEGPDGQLGWFVGSTFERAVSDGVIRPQDRASNLNKLRGLHPAAAQALTPAFESARDWAGVRCTLPDRVPAVGPVAPQSLPGLHVCTGLGARGLTLSVLCGELLAALLHGEPWPTEARLAQRLLAERFARP